jgi:hypothetical protein
MANAPDDYSITTTSTHLTASSAATSLLTIQNRKAVEGAANSGAAIVLIKSTATSSTPADWDGAIEIEGGDGFINKTIAELWPGSTNTYLHCKTVSGTATVSFASA